MSGICDTCQRNQVCRKSRGGADLCGLYVSVKESNYEKLFGTPERAARTVIGIVCSELVGCDSLCPIHTFCNAHADDEIPDDGGYGALLEWLRGDA